MNKIVVLDPGHGGSDPGACAKGLKEKDLVSSISKFCKEYLESKGIKVFQTRDTDKSISISERAAFANKRKAALFVSIHTNAGGGDGAEVIYSKVGGTSKVLAQNVIDSINVVTGQNKRPKEIYTKVGSDGKDYFGVIRETSMPAIIVECAFIDSKDVEIVDTSDERKLMGIAIAKGILKTLGITDKDEVKGTPIEGAATATLEQCKEWARSKQAKQTFIENAEIYFELCKRIGIDPVMAYAQYALESGHGHHKGVVPESYHNPCGLKVSKVGLNSDIKPDNHAKFECWEDGISAHLDHIALYAGVKDYPKSHTLDPRHFKDLYGKYKTVEEIGKGWCPSNPNYSSTLLRFMDEIKKIKVDDEYKAAAKYLHEDGVINTLSVWEDPKEIKLGNVPSLLIKCAKRIKELKE